MKGTVIRVVIDSGVLVEDAKGKESSREVMDIVRGNAWIIFIASLPLLDVAQKNIEINLGEIMAQKWREDIERICEIVDHAEGDHPALASAYVGNAQHIISLDERLTSAKGGVSIRARVETSVKKPEAFVKLFGSFT